jgi:hypothetical protein
VTAPKSQASAAKSSDLAPLKMAPMAGGKPPAPADVYADLLMLYEEVIGWYLREKERKKTRSKTLRGTALALVTCGGLIPLMSAVAPWVNAQVGYLFLAAAAALTLADKSFGYSAAWDRFVRLAVEANVLYLRLQVEWRSGVGRDRDTDHLWELVEGYAARLGELVLSETTKWSDELQSSIDELQSAVAIKGR